MSDTEHLTHFDGKATHELGISVMNECFRESHTFEHVFQVEFGDSLGCNHIIAWYEDDCFSAVMVRDCEYRVETV